ncbi:class I SAM-dependent rRNA methyltransferase, partial [Patescibacteria group bacterium]|nr:class I SAM-dependent rRNA methyltransferase [Patescibacteria group bacterium]MBU1613143.1 class I SAM-dependent rRNA methyltransferase [Patescibacteria group bacterium]
NPKGIYERSDVGHRAKEASLPLLTKEGRGEVQNVNNVKNVNNVGLLHGVVPEKIKIKENGLKFLVDVAGGQKTGFFLDQRDKREALKKYVKNKIVLNCFSYTGGFSVYALEGGAKKVMSVDVSESALKLAEENAKLNGFAKNHEIICADVKDYLSGCEGRKDVIILDPPAFIKDRRKIREGVQGYRKINEMAIRLLPTGGILVSASCSAHLSLPDFRYMLSEAGGRAGRTLQILETFTHGIDHPELVAFTEGEYLKCVFAIVN